MGPGECANANVHRPHRASSSMEPVPTFGWRLFLNCQLLVRHSNTTFSSTLLRFARTPFLAGLPITLSSFVALSLATGLCHKSGSHRIDTNTSPNALRKSIVLSAACFPLSLPRNVSFALIYLSLHVLFHFFFLILSFLFLLTGPRYENVVLLCS